MAAASDAARVLDEANVDWTDDPAALEPINLDWTATTRGDAAALARPADAPAVARLLEAAGSARVAITIQGGRTSLVAGAVPHPGAIAVSTERLRRIVRLEPATMTVVAEAGVTLADLDAELEAAGLEVGIDLGSRANATLGGLVATNAGGQRVVRYGSTANQLVHVDLVDGLGRTHRRIGRPPKAAGLDTCRFVAGSEGIYGVITAVALRVHPRPRTRIAIAIGADDFVDLVSLFETLRPLVAPWLEAAEFVRTADVRSAGLTPPDPHPLLLILQLTSPYPDDDRPLLLAPAHLDAHVATDPSQRARLWHLREMLPLLAERFGTPVKLDVAVPLGALGELAAHLDLVAERDEVRATVLFGHLAEGTCHVNLAIAHGADPGPLYETVLTRVAALGGVIASEHGIGRTKRRWARLLLDPIDEAALRSLKGIWDPYGIVNPGVLLPDP
ncbi:FAD linked oxidase domain protein [Acidimicrobium ferrooxidans DSM 10331]|uniref:FAD linked oxidase domain protein n=1 Tax=Acidimicrobium ferrooxidans (strain DSM 10331 / JCM 15462 / NBRC 103882 / ICP) TaxID=525909 RepID=C7LYY7_ACIFD|nr:FAD-binding oxidoreductase [Acidimicrobium ferrooxidans]ACU53945.1 FAD linked oxidase domain protein [Acidimicrobium ferrooxidans DSM 10331]